MLQELPRDLIRELSVLWENNQPFQLSLLLSLWCLSLSGIMLPLKVISVLGLKAKHEHYSKALLVLLSFVKLSMTDNEAQFFTWCHLLYPQLPQPRNLRWRTYFSFISRHQISSSMESPYSWDKWKIFQFYLIFKSYLFFLITKHYIVTIKHTRVKSDHIYYFYHLFY